MDKLEEFMKKQYTAIVIPQEATDGTMLYLAYHPDLEGCMSDGDTPEEALENLQEARRLYMETLLEKGLDIPEPKGILPTRTASSAATTVIWRTVVHQLQPPKDDTTIQKMSAPYGVFSLA